MHHMKSTAAPYGAFECEQSFLLRVVRDVSKTKVLISFKASTGSYVLSRLKYRGQQGQFS